MSDLYAVSKQLAMIDRATYLSSTQVLRIRGLFLEHEHT